jgi:hypothetical protein
MSIAKLPSYSGTDHQCAPAELAPCRMNEKLLICCWKRAEQTSCVGAIIVDYKVPHANAAQLKVSLCECLERHGLEP